MSDWDRWERFPPSRPLPAKGGIRAQSGPGGFGESWWAKRWIAVLESFQLGGRLQRGRSYARSGQVLDINIQKGEVTARVQGSRPEPYEVRMKVKPIPGAAWKKLGRAASRRALFAAKLLAGEMPQDIEKLFEEQHLSLFPERGEDLRTNCSCPDWSNPCKHIAAVYYLLGEEFDRDPFLIFRIRGITREEFIGLLAAGSAGVSPASKRAGNPRSQDSADPAKFWAMGELPAEVAAIEAEKNVGAALPRRLGNFPFWRGSEKFLTVMDAIYRAAREEAAMLLKG